MARSDYHTVIVTFVTEPATQAEALEKIRSAMGTGRAIDYIGE